MIKSLLGIILLVLLCNSNLDAAKNKYAFGGSFEKSLAIINMDNSSFNQDIIEGTFAFYANSIFKMSRNAYFNFSLGYTSYDYVAELGNYSSTSFDLKLLALTYFDKPDDFTPYVGGGGVLSFVSNDGPVLGDEFLNPIALEEVLIGLTGKFGFNIPLSNNLAADAGIEINVYLSEYMNFVPKACVGVVYWLD